MKTEIHIEHHEEITNTQLREIHVKIVQLLGFNHIQSKTVRQRGGSSKLHTMVECEDCLNGRRTDNSMCTTCNGTGVRTCLE